jgi:hypothetical protein
MRVIDILLTEASIFSRTGTYSYGHKVKLSAESAKGKIALERIQDQLPNFVPNEELTWVAPTAKPTAVVVLGRDSNMRYFKRPNGEVIAFQGSDSGIEAVINHSNKYNRGDIAEAILGASITAKLIKRGIDKIGEVSVDDVQKVLANAVRKVGTELQFTVEDKNSQIADKISFLLRLPSGSMDAVKNKKNWPKWNDLFAGATAYANSHDAERYSNHFYKNGKIDEVRIVSDGVSGQKDRKTDIQGLVTTTDPATGQVSQRTLKNIDISLKADSLKYGQSTAGGLKQTKKEWLVAAKRLFEPFGITIEMPSRNTSSLLDFYIGVYKQAEKKMKEKIAGASVGKEASFVETVADVVQSHGAGTQPNLKLVNLEKGGYSVHSFAILKQRMLAEKINLDVRMTVGARSGKPNIEIFDKTSGRILTKIRFYLTEKAATSYFEKGDLLHELTRIIKGKSAVSTPTVPAAPQNTAAPTAPTTATPTTAPAAKPLTIAPVSHGEMPNKDFNWTGRQKLAPVSTINGNQMSTQSTRTAGQPEEEEPVVAESKKKKPI